MVSQVANADLTGPLRGKRVTLWRSERCPQFPPALGVLGAGTRGRAVASGARGAKSQPRRGRAEGVAASNGLSVSPPLPSRGPAEGRRVPGAAPALRPGESGSALLRPAACHLPALSWALTPKGSRGHSSLVCRPLVLLPVQTLLSSQQQARPPGLRGWARPSPLLSFLPGTHVLEDFGHRTRPAFSYQSHPGSVPSLGVPEGWARGSGHTTWSSSYLSRIPTMSSGASQLLCTPGAGLL